MDENTVCVALARVSSDTQRIVSGTLKELAEIGKVYAVQSNLMILDLGDPLHCLIVTGKLHPMENEFLEKLKTIETKTE